MWFCKKKEVMNAQEACELTIKNEALNRKNRLKELIKRIYKEATYGNMYCIFYDQMIVEDIPYLESLGYKVEKKSSWFEISWDVCTKHP